jgi:hypothetical protein
MTPEAALHALNFINYIIVVFIATIIYCVGLIVYRVVKIHKSLKSAELRMAKVLETKRRALNNVANKNKT